MSLPLPALYALCARVAVSHSESKENVGEKKRLMDGSVEKMKATKRARGTVGAASSSKGGSKKKQKK